MNEAMSMIFPLYNEILDLLEEILREKFARLVFK